MNLISLVFVFLLPSTIAISSSKLESFPSSVHAFFYLWYGNVEIDGKYKHWDHAILPHWEHRVNEQYNEIGKRFSPPGLIHSPFYPQKGTYSSSDTKIMKQQFDDFQDAGIEVAVVSWWGQASKPYATDTQVFLRMYVCCVFPQS